MASFPQCKTNGIQWVVWKMEESLDTLLLPLPDARKAFCEQELNRFVSEHCRVEWLSARVLLHSMLQEGKGIDYSPERKPCLTDHSLFISTPHTKGYVAMMLASSVPIGIDIKQYTQRVHKVYGRCVHPNEQVESYQGDIAWGLLLCWSAKKAVFKRMENVDANLRKLRLTHSIPQEEGTFQVQKLAMAQQELYSVGYRICQDLVLTWTLN